MKIVFFTAGAAGMYCGSCMHDNALARALTGRGHQCILQPLYTPIRTDDESVARDNVFFGGIHIYLLDRFPLLRFIPGPLRRILDFPPLLRFVTRRFQSTRAENLGHLTVSMLRGEDGPQADEVHRLVDWLKTERPDAIILTNLLIGGPLPNIRARLPKLCILTLLQGDDIYLDHLPPPSQQTSIELLQGLVQHVNHFVTYSRSYAESMSRRLRIPMDRIEVHPLSIALPPTVTPPSPTARDEDNASIVRLGYMARFSPEKGFDRLVDAFIDLAPHHPTLHLHAAGYQSIEHRKFFDDQVRKLAAAGLLDRWVFHGEVSLHEKHAMLSSLDLLSVPTRYADPKGIFVLEAWSVGTPVVMPDIGAFPELIGASEAGLLFDNDDPSSLAETIEQLLDDLKRRKQMSETARRWVRSRHGIDQAAIRMIDLIHRNLE